MPAVLDLDASAELLGDLGNGGGEGRKGIRMSGWAWHGSDDERQVRRTVCSGCAAGNQEATGVQNDAPQKATGQSRAAAITQAPVHPDKAKRAASDGQWSGRGRQPTGRTLPRGAAASHNQEERENEQAKGDDMIVFPPSVAVVAGSVLLAFPCSPPPASALRRLFPLLVRRASALAWRPYKASIPLFCLLHHIFLPPALLPSLLR